MNGCAATLLTAPGYNAAMKSVLLMILSVLLAAVLYLTNPNSEDFSRRFAEQLSPQLTQGLETGVGMLDSVLGGAARSGVSEVLRRVSERQDYYLASVYTIPRRGENMQVLGIAGQFVQLREGSGELVISF